MRPVLEQAAKVFDPIRHQVGVLDGPWVELHDEAGRVLEGIRGRPGAYGTTIDGKEIGADLIEMRPGSAFAPHVHEGDHLLFFLAGTGFVHIDGADRRVTAGDTVFIAGAHPHAVRTDRQSGATLAFLAIGVPHKHVSATDRMTYVPPAEEPH